MLGFTSTVSTLPSGSSVQVSSSVGLPSLVLETEPNFVPAFTQLLSEGSHSTVAAVTGSPIRTRPSASTQAATSPLIPFMVVGLSAEVINVKLFVAGSNTSPEGENFPVPPPGFWSLGSLEYSPPTTNARPSLKTPLAKNCRVYFVVMVDDQVPDSYVPSSAGVRRSHSFALAALCTSTEPSVSSNMMSPRVVPDVVLGIEIVGQFAMRGPVAEITQPCAALSVRSCPVAV